MIFASTSLAARIERAERGLLADCAAAASRLRPESGVLAMPLAGGVATWTGDGSPLNKVAGLGFEGPLDLGELAAVERALAERGAAVQVELSCLADPSIAAALTRRGYTLEGFENVLGRPVKESARRDSGEIAVSTSDLSELSRWLDVVAVGFAAPDDQGVASHESSRARRWRRRCGTWSRPMASGATWRASTESRPVAPA